MFASAGSYSVSLVVNDTFGLRNSTVQTVSVTRDSIAPTTSNNYNGSLHTSAFTIVLTAQDSQSGVAATYYKINDGQTQTVAASGQPRISSEGQNKLEYWSTDIAGNTEEHKILTGIKLDTSAASTPTQSPPPTVKPTVAATATPTPTADISTNPTSSASETVKPDGQEPPSWILYISVIAAGIVVLLVAVPVWLKRK